MAEERIGVMLANDLDILGENSTGQSQEDVVATIDEPHRYDQKVELLIPRPINAHRLLLLSNRLREQYHVEVLQSIGSWEGGTSIRLLLRKAIDLKEVLASMPEVAQVWQGRPESCFGGYVVDPPARNRINDSDPVESRFVHHARGSIEAEHSHRANVFA